MTPEDIRARLRSIFKPPEQPCNEPVPDGFPGRDEKLSHWLATYLPDLDRTPKAILENGDQGMLLMLARFVNAIATSRALSHPNAVHAIVRRRVEDLFEQTGSIGPLVSELPCVQPEATQKVLYEQWMAFDNDHVDGGRLRHVSGLLDAIDDGAFS